MRSTPAFDRSKHRPPVDAIREGWERKRLVSNVRDSTEGEEGSGIGRGRERFNFRVQGFAVTCFEIASPALRV